MSIEFFDLLEDEGWVAQPLDPFSDRARWSEGGLLAEAPVDVEATFDGHRWQAAGIDPTFGLTGIRLAAGFTVPLHHHDQQVLRIVYGGEFEIRSDEATATVRAGQFTMIDEATVHSLVAGPEGVTYTESWRLEAPDVITTWYPDPAWVLR